MKIFVTIILVLLVLLGFVVELDSSALSLHDESFERAMIAFGLAKGLNAVISLIQSTEVSAGIGMGITVGIGELLDPFNDMVERFSWAMLFATVSLGIQKLLLLLGSKLFLQIALGLSALVSLVFLWQKKIKNNSFFIFSLKLFMFLVILRFGAIAFVYSADIFYKNLLHVEYINSSKIIESTQNNLQQYKDAKSYFNVKSRLASLEQSIEKSYKKIISLITIFAVHSVVLPLLFLWFFVNLMKLIWRVRIEKEWLYRYFYM